MIITGASQSNHPNSPHHRPTTKSTVKSRINCTDHKIAAMPRLTALDLLEAQGLPRHMYLLSAEEAATLDREALEDDCDAVFQVSHSTHRRSQRFLLSGLGQQPQPLVKFEQLGLHSTTKHSKSFSAFGSQHRTSPVSLPEACKPVNAKVYRGSYENPRSLPSFSSSVATLSHLRKNGVPLCARLVCRHLLPIQPRSKSSPSTPSALARVGAWELVSVP